MKRYLPLFLLLLVGSGLVVWRLTQPKLMRPPAQPAQPLEPIAPSVQAALQFLQAWARGDARAVYEMLSANMKRNVSAADFAAMMAERKFSEPHVIAHVETAEAAFVVAKIQALPAKGIPPCAGFSLLLKKEQDQWRVAHLQEEEQLFTKYEDLRLSSGQDKGWTVTYQNEKGQIVTIKLPDV